MSDEVSKGQSVTLVKGKKENPKQINDKPKKQKKVKRMEITYPIDDDGIYL